MEIKMKLIHLQANSSFCWIHAQISWYMWCVPPSSGNSWQKSWAKYSGIYIFSLTSLIVYAANNAKRGWQDFLIWMYLRICNFAFFHSIVLLYLRGAATKRAEIDREGAGRRYARAKSIDSMIFWKINSGPMWAFQHFLDPTFDMSI